jgi:predicted nucleic acid-binding protein
VASSPKRIAWDSCAWIAHIQQEKIRDGSGKIVEDRGALCRPVLQAAETGALEIVVSAISLAEVICRNRAAGIDDQKVRDYFDNDYILLVAADKQVGDCARQLMLAGHPRLKPADAIHLATAIVAGAEELHTFDDILLALSGKISRLDGVPLTIRKPTVPAPPAPLLEELERQ